MLVRAKRTPCSPRAWASSRAYVHTPPTVSVVSRTFIFSDYGANLARLPSHGDQRFEKPVGAVAGHLNGVTQRFERKAMREKRERVEPSGCYFLDSLLHAPVVDSRIALVGVDHVKAAPVPQLQVDLPEAVLVITRDYEPPAYLCQLPGQIQRPLLADRLDDNVAEFAVC